MPTASSTAAACWRLPGLINAHQHLYQASLRTIPGWSAPACRRSSRCRTPSPLIGGGPGQLGAREQRAIARAALTESVLGGNTTVADQHLFFPGIGRNPM